MLLMTRDCFAVVKQVRFSGWSKDTEHFKTRPAFLRGSLIILKIWSLNLSSSSVLSHDEKNPHFPLFV